MKINGERPGFWLSAIMIGCTLGLLPYLTGCPPKTRPERVDVLWEKIPDPGSVPCTWRTPTPHGWLVVGSSGVAAYVPDHDHSWLTVPRPKEPPADAEILDWPKESDDR